MKLNESICIEEQQDQLLLKIRDENHLVKLSKIEYEIIAYYCQVLDKQAVIAFFSAKVEIGAQQLETLLDLAKQKGILVEKVAEKKSFFQLRLKRRKAIFELLFLDFTGSLFERLVENKKLRMLLFWSWIGLTLGALCYLFGYPIAFIENYKSTLYLVPYSFKQLIVFIYLGAFASIIIHEWGHYFFYKLYKGKCSIFGIGLLLFVIPVFYNKLYIQQVSTKKHRLWIYAGGILWDMTTVVWILLGTIVWKDTHPTFVFIGYSMLLSIGIRFVFNINVFLPQTDGYFILNDWIGKENLWRESYLVALHLRKKPFTIQRLLYLLYFIFSCLAVVFAWGCFTIPLFLLVLYACSS